MFLIKPFQASNAMTFSAISLQKAMFINSTISIFQRMAAFTYNAIQQTLLRGIAQIIFVCSKKQMIGSYAEPVIARMANKKSSRDVPIGDNPGKSICAKIFAMPPNASITSFAFAANPSPARISLINGIPEFRDCFHGRIIAQTI